MDSSKAVFSNLFCSRFNLTDNLQQRVDKALGRDRRKGAKWKLEYELLCFHPKVLTWLIERGEKCYYCRIPLSTVNLSLDRINNRKHHSSDNVILCCSPCNVARSNNFSVEEFRLLCSLLLAIRARPKFPLTIPRLPRPPLSLQKLVHELVPQDVLNAVIAENANLVEKKMLAKIVSHFKTTRTLNDNREIHLLVWLQTRGLAWDIAQEDLKNNVQLNGGESAFEQINWNYLFSEAETAMYDIAQNFGHTSTRC